MKVFASLSGFLTAYRIGDPEELLMQSCEALIAGREYMRTKPKPRAPQYVNWTPSPTSWMAA